MSATMQTKQPTVPPANRNGGRDVPPPPPAQAPPAAAHDLRHDLPRPTTRTVTVVVAAFVLLLVAMFLVGWFPHHHAQKQARDDASQAASETPVVNVAQPQATAMSKDLVLPGDVRANQETAIYPRANGYLQLLKHDINDRVTAGELLAVIAAPEVDAQLAQARASLEQSQANVLKSQADLDLAQRTLSRYQDAQKSVQGSVTAQDIDAKKSAVDDAASAVALAKASVTAAQATVQQLAATQGFEQVTAPFAGVITARNFDVGALLNPANSSEKELFDIAQTDPLRVFVNVPQTYATGVQIGQPAYLRVRNFPDREFTGVIARSSGALDPTTRTLRVEVHFPNPDQTLFAGMYGQVRLPIMEDHPILKIPTSALVFDTAGLRVGKVQDGKAHFEKITVGRDLGTEIEVTQGVSASDKIIANPGEKLAEGIPVKVFDPNQPQPEKTEKVAEAVQAND